MSQVLFTVVAPAHNEQENVCALVEEVERACRGVLEVLAPQHQIGAADASFEFIVVDDGSTDDTRRALLDLARERPWLRVIAMRDTPPGRGNGQSAAFHAGFRAAQGPWLASLDADLQNDPADFVAMAHLLVEHTADMVQGDRSANRRDNVVRRVGSVVGRLFRRLLLNDIIRDTGCSLRVMRREIALRLPLEFKGAHRFIPITARQLGYTVVEMPVNHRPRVAGETKYGMGVIQRALPGLIDCFAIRWMGKRRRPVTHEEVRP
ncbi:MAG: glycosyltransferase family 2 protein [Phycisphaerales bacterium]|nr:glycosyltransferase family 2 protein [Phycisphaerales bacterium]